MKKNIKTITINIPDDNCLKRINNTPTLKSLFHSKMKVGDNEYNCNHFNYSQIERLQCGLFKIIEKL